MNEANSHTNRQLILQNAEQLQSYGKQEENPEEEANWDEPFPIEALPETAKAMTEAVVASTGAAPEIVGGVCAIGAMSTALGCWPKIKTDREDRLATPNLFLLGAAHSGVGKSEAMREMLRPIQELEPTLRKEDKRILLEDATEQSMEILLEHHKTLSLVSPDARNLLKNIQGRNSRKYSDTEESILLKAWSLDPIYVDRVGKEEGRNELFIPHPCLSMSVLVQPDRFIALWRDDRLRNSGLLPRILPVLSETRPTTIPKTGRPPIPSETANEWKKLLQTLVEEFHFTEDQPVIELKDEAKALIIDFQNTEMEVAKKNDDQVLYPYVSRLAEHAWRIAVVLHAAHHMKEAKDQKLTVETARDAVKLTKWYWGNQQTILADTQSFSTKEIEDRIISTAYRNDGSISTREIQRKRICNSAESAKEVLEKMVEKNLMEAEEKGIRTIYKLLIENVGG
jgi:hypothetical protein